MRSRVIGLVVVLLLGCGTDTRYVAHATPQAEACGEYAQILQSLDLYCGLDCDNGCRRGYLDRCFEGTGPDDIDRIDQCAELAPSFNCDGYRSRAWIPVCNL